MVLILISDGKLYTCTELFESRLEKFYLFYKSHEPKKRKRSTASPDLALVCTFMTENLLLYPPFSWKSAKQHPPNPALQR